MPKGVYQHNPNQGFQKGDKNPSRSIEGRTRISEIQKGRKLSQAWKDNIGLAIRKLGIVPPSPKGRKHSVESILKRAEACKRTWDKKGRKIYSRPKHQGTDYRLWRTAVYERDNYTCQECGIRGGEINADHIKPWSLFPELRFSLENGRTLCVPCHKKTDTYGGKARRYSIAESNMSAL